MPTLTVRNVPVKTVRALKAQAKRNGRSMEQEIRVMLEARVKRARAVEQIRRSWAKQTRPTTPEEVDAWIRESRP